MMIERGLIAMVEGEMKEISEAEMLKQLNLLHTSKPNGNCKLLFVKKEVRTRRKRRRSYLR
jgi:hypothetical protein